MQSAATVAPPSIIQHIGKISPPPPHKQFYAIPLWLLERNEPGLPHRAKLLYGIILHFSTTFGRCWAGHDYFAQLLGCCRETVISDMAILRRHNLLAQVRRQNKTNLYIPNLNHPWIAEYEAKIAGPRDNDLPFFGSPVPQPEVEKFHTIMEPCSNTNNMGSSSARAHAREADDETSLVEKESPFSDAPPRQTKLKSVQPPVDPTLAERKRLAEEIVAVIEELIALGARTEPIRNKAGYLHTLTSQTIEELRAALEKQEALLDAARRGPTRPTDGASIPLWLTAQADTAERNTFTGCSEPWLAAWSDLPEFEQAEWRQKAERKLFDEKLLGEGRAVDRELRIRRVARNLFREKWEAEQAAVAAEAPPPAENSLEEIWERPDFELGGFVSRAVMQLAEEGVDLEDYEGSEAEWHALMQERALTLYRAAKATEGTDDATDDGWNGDRVQAGTDIAVEIHQVEATDEPNADQELLTLGVNASSTESTTNEKGEVMMSGVEAILDDLEHLENDTRAPGFDPEGYGKRRDRIQRILWNLKDLNVDWRKPEKRGNEIAATVSRFGKLMLRTAWNTCQGVRYLEWLGETDFVSDWAREKFSAGKPCLDWAVIEAGAKYLGDEFSGSVLDSYFLRFGEGSFIMETEFGEGWIDRHLAPTIREIERFAEVFGIPLRVMNSGIINAGAELARNEYNLVVSVLKRGSPIATVMSALGEPVVFLEWHKRWKGKPIRRRIGPDIPLPRRASRILVCEHDTHTGQTVSFVVDWLQRFEPQELDFVFLADPYRTNRRRVEAVGGNLILPETLPRENFNAKLELVRSKAEQGWKTKSERRGELRKGVYWAFGEPDMRKRANALPVSEKRPGSDFRRTDFRRKSGVSEDSITIDQF